MALARYACQSISVVQEDTANATAVGFPRFAVGWSAILEVEQVPVVRQTVFGW